MISFAPLFCDIRVFSRFVAIFLHLCVMVHSPASFGFPVGISHPHFPFRTLRVCATSSTASNRSFAETAAGLAYVDWANRS